MRFFNIITLALLLQPALVIAQCANFTASHTKTDILCYGDTTGTVTVNPVGGTPPYTYVWNTVPNQTTQTAVNLPAGVYTVTVQDANNCVLNELVTINEPPALVSGSGKDSAICNNTTLRLEGITLGGTPPYQYFWSCNQTNCSLSANNILTPEASPSTTTSYFFYIEDANGCQSRVDTIEITVFPLPTVDAGQNQTIYLGESAQLNATSSENGSFSWTPNATLNNATISNPVATPDDTTTYQVVFTDGNGCMSVDDVTIFVDFNIEIPTAFTPNGDNFNDTWAVKGLTTFPDVQVAIYNRYGSRVFSSTGYNTPWDGTYNSKMMPAGTYFYVIKINKNDGQTYSGAITLIR